MSKSDQPIYMEFYMTFSNRHNYALTSIKIWRRYALSFSKKKQKSNFNSEKRRQRAQGQAIIEPKGRLL